MPVTDVLAECELDLWLLAHRLSRHLRRIAVAVAARVPRLSNSRLRMNQARSAPLASSALISKGHLPVVWRNVPVAAPVHL